MGVAGFLVVGVAAFVGAHVSRLRLGSRRDGDAVVLQCGFKGQGTFSLWPVANLTLTPGEAMLAKGGGGSLFPGLRYPNLDLDRSAVSTIAVHHRFYVTEVSFPELADAPVILPNNWSTFFAVWSDLGWPPPGSESSSAPRQMLDRWLRRTNRT